MPPNPAAMSRLCSTFPSLRGVPGAEPWDVSVFVDWLVGPAPSPAASAAGLFVLGVWDAARDWNEEVAHLPPRPCAECGARGRVDAFGNATTATGGGTRPCPRCGGECVVRPRLGAGRFDLFRAVPVWDAAHRAALRAWLEEAHPS